MIKYSVNLQSILDFHLSKMNKSRKKFLCGLVLCMLESRSVSFTDLAAELNASAKVESNLRRIQSFFSDFDLEYLAWARLLMQFVPQFKLTLVLDRTNWQFGETDINILCLTVRLHDVGLPILFSFLDSQGNSQTTHRCDLLDKFDELFGFSRISCLIADREFIGEGLSI
jgi:hypothetical protein